MRVNSASFNEYDKYDTFVPFLTTEIIGFVDNTFSGTEIAREGFGPIAYLTGDNKLVELSTLDFIGRVIIDWQGFNITIQSPSLH